MPMMSRFASKQPTTLYFTHDNLSTLANTTNQSYNEKVEEICNSKNGSNCPLFRSIGHVVSTNFTFLHSSLLYQSLVDQAILRKSTGDSDIEIKPTIHPLTFSMSSTIRLQLKQIQRKLFNTTLAKNP